MCSDIVFSKFDEWVQFRKKSCIPGDLNFTVESVFVRFGSSMFYGGALVFRSSKGISFSIVG